MLEAQNKVARDIEFPLAINKDNNMYYIYFDDTNPPIDAKKVGGKFYRRDYEKRSTIGEPISIQKIVN